MKTYLIIILSLIIFYLSYELILPFLTPLLFSVIVAFAAYPVYGWMNRYIKNKYLCSVVIILLIVLLVLVPLSYAINLLAKDAFVAYITIKQKLYRGELFPTACVKSILCDMSQSVNAFLSEQQTRYYIQLVGDKLQQYLVEYGSNFLFKLPAMIIDLIIFFVTLFYFLKDGDQILDFIKNLLPLDKKHQDHLYKKTGDTIYAILYGQFLTAFIQGGLGALTFYFLGLTSPVFWGAAMSLFSIIPIGTWVIWLPAAINLIMLGFAPGQQWFFWKGIILLLIGAFVISTIDNIIKPYLIGTKTKIHMAVVIVGLFGGVKMFGFIGLFIGPIILMLTLAIFDIYNEMRAMKRGGKQSSSKQR